MPAKKKPSFEESLALINQELEKRRNKWTLFAVPHIDYEDVAQIIRTHIWKKWHLYNPHKPLVNWLNSVISNQTYNLLRNHYYNFARPCVGCKDNQGDNLCAIYVTQCAKCPLYSKWLKTKKLAHDIKLPVTLENHTQEVFEIPIEVSDEEGILENLKFELKKVLTITEYKIFELAFLEHLKDEDVITGLGYPKPTEKNRIFLKAAKLLITEHAKKIVYAEAHE